MATDLLTNQLTNIGGIIAAIAALGTAAYGLVDVTKVFDGGISNVGLKFIVAALEPFAPALEAVQGVAWKETVRAHWINGMAKDDQKAIAKSLIHLGLSPANAGALATDGRVSADALTQVVRKLDNGTDLSPADINVLGRFDSMIDAKLDGAFDRADQAYRNASKATAALIAVVLAVAGEAVIMQSGGNNAITAYGLAVLIGLVSVPLAPIAKDLSSALNSAVKSLKAVGA